MTAPFISLADLSDALGEDVSTSDLAVIAIDSACQVVRDELANTVNLITEEAVMDGHGRYRLVLPQPPVREVSSVVLLAYGVADTTVAATDYVLERRMYLRRLSDVWPIGYGNIVITYTHGWAITETPFPRESHLTHNDSHFEMYGTRKAAQTFASPITHYLTAVDLGVHIEGTPPNPLAVGIYAIDATTGDPTGLALGSGSVAVVDAGTVEGGIERATITPAVRIVADTTYAIVCSTTAGDASNDWHWTFDSTAADYANGQKLTTLNGTVWTAAPTHDFVFTEFEAHERVPSSIRQVALGLASRIYGKFGTEVTTGAVTSEQIGSYRYTVDSASAVAASSGQLLGDEKAALAPYKALVFA